MGKIIRNTFKKLIGPILGGVLGGKAKGPAALPMATRDDAGAAIAADDELRRRKGAAADMITGVRGAEAVGSVGKLVVGN